MKRTLIFLFLLSLLVECKEREAISPEVKATPCVTAYEDTRRQDTKTIDQPGMVIGGRIYQLIPSDVPPYDFAYRTPAVPCNLPERYRKDSLIVTFSGYYLTSPLLELIQISAIPFELTNIELRK